MQERLLSVADRLDARSRTAQHCAEEAMRRDADRQRPAADASGGVQPGEKPSG